MLIPPHRRSSRSHLRLIPLVTVAIGLVACAAPRVDEATRTSDAPRATGRAAPSSGLTSTPATATATAPTTPAPTTPASAPTDCAADFDVSSWSVVERAARLVVLPSLDFALDGLAQAISLGVGGILFLGSAPAPADLAQRISVATRAPRFGVPPITMADEEGGGIRRLSGLVDEFGWPREVAQTMTPTQVEALGTRVGNQMRSGGIDMDLAPVLDADGRPGPSSSNPDGKRSYSADPAIAGQYGVAFSTGLTKAGVISVGKHFPGLGQSQGNSDLGASVTRPWATLQSEDLQSFRAAIAAGVPAIMVANASVPDLTSQPATLSPAVVQQSLRGDLGFQGTVLTDSISAGSIRDAGYSLPEAATAAIIAGVDLILFGSTLDSRERDLLAPQHVLATALSIIDAIASAVADGRLSLSRLDEAVGHVLELSQLPDCTSSKLSSQATVASEALQAIAPHSSESRTRANEHRP